jgi:hypothetical protein
VENCPVLAWGARGPEFESRQPDQFFQSDASHFQCIRNPGVVNFVDNRTARFTSFPDHSVGVQEVPSSNLGSPTKFFNRMQAIFKASGNPAESNS